MEHAQKRPNLEETRRQGVGLSFGETQRQWTSCLLYSNEARDQKRTPLRFGTVRIIIIGECEMQCTKYVTMYVVAVLCRSWSCDRLSRKPELELRAS